MRVATLIGAGFVLFAAMDLVWLGIVANSFYRSELGPVITLGQGLKYSHYLAGAVTWLLIALGAVCFVLPRAHEGAGVSAAAAWGALLGLVIYGVYDSTNLAVLRGWTLKAAVVDVVWGTFACAVLGMLLFSLDRWLFR